VPCLLSRKTFDGGPVPVPVLRRGVVQYGHVQVRHDEGVDRRPRTFLGSRFSYYAKAAFRDTSRGGVSADPRHADRDLGTLKTGHPICRTCTGHLRQRCSGRGFGMATHRNSDHLPPGANRPRLEHSRGLQRMAASLGSGLHNRASTHDRDRPGGNVSIAWSRSGLRDDRTRMARDLRVTD
jgi:hypothetical protein